MTALEWVLPELEKESTERSLQEARFLVVEQKYLELLEAGQTKRALSVLRTEVAPVAQEIAAASTSSPVSLRNLSLRSPNLSKPDRQGSRRRRASNRLDDVLPPASSSRHAGVGSGSMMLDSGAELGASRIRADEAEDPWGGDDDLDIDYDDVEDAGTTVTEAKGETEPAALARLSELSSYLMCGSPEEVRQRSGWAGIGGNTRSRVLDAMQGPSLSSRVSVSRTLTETRSIRPAVASFPPQPSTAAARTGQAAPKGRLHLPRHRRPHLPPDRPHLPPRELPPAVDPHPAPAHRRGLARRVVPGRPVPRHGGCGSKVHYLEARRPRLQRPGQGPGRRPARRLVRLRARPGRPSCRRRCRRLEPRLCYHCHRERLHHQDLERQGASFFP